MKQHQERNLASIGEYPLTQLTSLSERAMGSVCPPIYDSDKERLYLAANYQGKFAHISYIDLKTKKEHILRKLDGPMLRTTCYLAFDKKRNRLIYTINNGSIRGLEAIDADSGRRIYHRRLQRISNLEYDNSRDCLYGIMVSSGVNHLVRLGSSLESKEFLYSFPFGQSVSSLSISSTGEKLLAHLSKPNGNTALISFSIADLENAKLGYEEILELDNVGLTDFRFADSDSTLIGSSNYTGVQNIWSVDVDTKEMKLISNVETGLFAPTVYDRDTLVALHFESNGFRPVKFARKELKDANSIVLLGQLAFEKNPDLKDLAVTDSEVGGGEGFAQVYNRITEYHPVKEMRFTGAYPVISGFRDVSAWGFHRGAATSSKSSCTPHLSGI